MTDNQTQDSKTEVVYPETQVQELVKSIDANLKAFSTKIDDALTPKEVKEQKAREEAKKQPLTREDLDSLKKDLVDTAINTVKAKDINAKADADYNALMKDVKKVFKSNDIKWNNRYQGIFDKTLVEVIDECVEKGITNEAKIHKEIKKAMFDIVRIQNEELEEEELDEDMDEYEEFDDDEDSDEDEEDSDLLEKAKSKLKDKKNSTFTSGDVDVAMPKNENELKSLIKKVQNKELTHAQETKLKEQIERYMDSRK